MFLIKTQTVHILILLLLFEFCHAFDVFQEKRIVNSSELCVIPITPSLFNWEKNPESVNEIEYNARISHSPDLPSWLQYTYDAVSSTGFLFGVPPNNIDSISIDVIAWNHYSNYEVRMLIISLEIMKQVPEMYTVELKIDNMNVQDLCKPRIMNRVIGIFSQYLNWTYSDGQNVHPVYLASAVELGENRIPLRPNEAEGVVVHLASPRNFSKALYKLEEEVLNLPKLKPCPRDMKRTSMERFFRSQNVLVDWCSFRLTVLSQAANVTSLLKPDKRNSQDGTAIIVDGEAVKHISGNKIPDDGEDIFHFVTEIPERGYGLGIILATVIPGTIGGLIGFLLLVLLWNDRDEDVPVFKRKIHEEIDNRSAANESEIDVGIIIRDCVDSNLEDDGRDALHTPLPPQYGETHPNGSPALIYAV